MSPASYRTAPPRNTRLSTISSGDKRAAGIGDRARQKRRPSNAACFDEENSTDTKSAIGGTRVSEAATPSVAAGNRVSTTRIVGAAAVALAASVVVQNAVFFVGPEAPTYATPLGEVLAYHAENRGVVAVSVGLEAVILPLLLLFVTGLHGLVQRRGGAGADWSRLAVAAGATLAADGLAEPTPAFKLAWQLHAAAFALALPALGATFIGAALATNASGLTRPWQ